MQLLPPTTLTPLEVRTSLCFGCAELDLSGVYRATLDGEKRPLDSDAFSLLLLFPNLEVPWAQTTGRVDEQTSENTWIPIALICLMGSTPAAFSQTETATEEGQQDPPAESAESEESSESDEASEEVTEGLSEEIVVIGSRSSEPVPLSTPRYRSMSFQAKTLAT